LSFAHVKPSRTKYIRCGDGTIHAKSIHFSYYVTYTSRNMWYYIILHCLDSTTIRTNGRISCPRLATFHGHAAFQTDHVLSLSLFLSPRIYTCKTPPLIHPAPLILSLALSNTTDPQASQPSPPPKTLGTLHNPSTCPQPFRLASIASEQADFACYCGALWIRHLWREHYEMCNRCVVMCPTVL
jgi:hypothetical protein